jgi:hypothetical protein
MVTLVAICLFGFVLTLNIFFQAFFFALLEDESPSMAIFKGWKFFRKNYLVFLTYHFLLIFLIFPVLTQGFLDVLVFTVFLYIKLCLVLNYLLRKKYLVKSPPDHEVVHEKELFLYSNVFLLATIISFVYFLLFSLIVVRFHPQLVRRLDEARNDILINQTQEMNWDFPLIIHGPGAYIILMTPLLLFTTITLVQI